MTEVIDGPTIVSMGGFTTGVQVVPLYKMLSICYKEAEKVKDYKALLEIIKIMQQNNLKELQL